MKNNLVALFVFLLFLLPLSLLAQDLPKIIPPSPEAASLLKHAQTDVSLYTGTPNINVPFHNVSYQGVSIPIGVSYNSGGIKVEDIASWVGLGWNLNAGGLVSRSIRALPDDANYGYMNTPYTIADFLTRDPTTMNANGQTAQLLSHNADQRDYEPDIFNYSIPGYSGQFFYDQNLNNFVQTPYSNIIIEPKLQSNNRINGFVITTPDGVKYHFGVSINNLREGLEKLEGAKTIKVTYNGVYESDPSVYGGSSGAYYQSWMLMDVQFPTSDKLISFDYSLEPGIKTTLLQNEKFTKYTSGSCNQEYDITFVQKEFNQPKISTITFPNGSLKFIKAPTHPSEERLDLKKSYPLQKIELYDGNLELIKGIELHTSYFTSPSVVDQPAGNINSYFDFNNEGSKRLKLDSISQFGSSPNFKNSYQFEYNELILPNRYSKSQDYFGYYNGKKKNVSLIPKAQYFYPFYFGDANRSVDPLYTKACSLDKIVYPTGGYDKFVWENNSVGFFINGSATYIDHLLNDLIEFSNNSVLFDDPDPSIDYSRSFTIPQHSDGKVNFEIIMNGCSQDLNNHNCAASLKIVGVSNPNFMLNILQSNFESILPPGDYEITAVSNSETQSCDPLTDPTCMNLDDYFSARLSWTVDPSPNDYIYGGLRIARIDTYSQANYVAYSRLFEYDLFSENNTHISSGSTFNLPNNQFPIRTSGGNGSSCFGMIIKSDIIPELTKGKHVGYKNVTETLIDQNGNNNGRKEYTFSIIDGQPDNLIATNYYDSPFPTNIKTPVYRDWLYGNMERLDLFDASNNILKTQINEYEQAATYYAPEFGVEVYRMPGVPATGINHEGEGFIDNYFVAYYLYTSEWHRLKNSTTTNYFDNGNLIESIDYAYSNNPLLASQIKITASDLMPIINKVFYPNDITSNSYLGFDNLSASELLAIQNLQSPSSTNLNGQHRINTPIQTEVYKDLNNNNNTETIELLNVNRTKYKDWGSGLMHAEIVQTGKGVNPILEDRIQFHDYDNYGNPLEVSKIDGTHIIYVWGYNNTQPIAKIENASYIGMSSGLINIITSAKIESNNDDDNCGGLGCKEQQLRDALENLRNHSELSNAMVSTYTYDPLIGITSMTDSRNYTIYYEYDGFNRLKQVKDQNGNILSDNQYHYFSDN